MKIFRVLTNNPHQNFFVDDQNFSGLDFILDGSTLSANWSPPCMTKFDPDVPMGGVVGIIGLIEAIVFDGNTYDLLKKHLHRCGQIFTFSFEGEVFYLLNVTLCNDVELMKSSDNVCCQTNPRFRRYDFRITSPPLGFFKIPETGACEILCCDGSDDSMIKNHIENLGIKSLRFQELWDSTTGPTIQVL